MTLREIILDEIRREGPIPFSRYMELCLYHPELGFYSRSVGQFGKAGDFYTSSDVHAVFGRLLARQFEEMWRALGRPERIEVIELGPGRGLFARDVLDWAKKKFPDFFRAVHCRLVERSPALRTAIGERLKDKIREGKASVWSELDQFPPVENAIIFANEFFDALPVEVVSDRGELRVSADGDRFSETFAPVRGEILDYLDRHGVHPEPGERVEASLIAQQWMRRLAKRIMRGYVVVIDYGYTRDELLTGRNRGTVTAFRKHTVSDSPYEAPGEQDITAHVNFTALRAAGEAGGLEFLGYMTQSQFLMGIGEANEFADAFEDTRLPQEQTKIALQLKHLVTPAGMGETFRVLVMGRGAGRELSGLTFAR